MSQSNGKKVKVHFNIEQARKAQRGSRYTFTLSLTSALDEGCGQLHSPAALALGMTHFALHRRLGGPQGRTGRAQKIFPPTWIRSSDRPARMECYTNYDISAHRNTMVVILYLHVYLIPPPPMTQQPIVGQGLLVIEALRSHPDTLHSVRLLWTSDRLVAETTT